MGFLDSLRGSGAVDMMRAIKQALDPKNILKTGKIFVMAQPAGLLLIAKQLPRFGIALRAIFVKIFWRD